MVDLWETRIEDPLMRGRFNMAQITLACALDYELQVLGSGWQQEHPKLASWLEEIAERPSIAATAPPENS